MTTAPAMVAPNRRFTVCRLKTGLAAALLCLCYLGWGCLWLSGVGIHTDEAIFASGIYPPFGEDRVVRVGGHEIPIMLMPYLGTVKSWLYRPLLWAFSPSPWLVRLPPLALGALTLWLFYGFLRRTAGSAVAWIGLLLLATDSIFLLTTRWDWGPVAVQHLCLVGALRAFAEYVHRRTRIWLFVAGLALGIGLWDKATFGWLLLGLSCGAVRLYRSIQSELNLRAAGAMLAGILLGAAPLLCYNLRSGGATFRAGYGLSAAGLAAKAALALETLSGAALFGVVTRVDGGAHVRNPATAGERLLVWLNQTAGSPSHSLHAALFFGATGVWLWRRKRNPMRLAEFALLALVGAWGAMAFTRDGGVSVHHTILLWPLPPLFTAAVLGNWHAAAGRWARVAISALTGAAALSGLALTSTYYAHQIRHGATAVWTDAIYSLSDALGEMNPREVCLLDWGFLDNLRLLHSGRLNLRVLDPPQTPEQRAAGARLLTTPDVVYVARSPSPDWGSSAAGGWLDFAASMGYERDIVRSFCDRNGRAVVETFGFKRRAPGGRDPVPESPAPGLELENTLP